VLRLHSLGLKQRQIARACAVGQSTVSDYIKQAEAAGLTWAEVADWDEDRLLAKLAPVAKPALPKVQALCSSCDCSSKTSTRFSFKAAITILDPRERR
jgi:predicted transcriptional regulator